MTDSLQRSYRHAEHTTAIWAKSFHFASRFLPLEKKPVKFSNLLRKSCPCTLPS